MRYADCPVDEEAANHRALGSSCNHSPDAETMCSCAPAATFTILSQGAWQEHAEAHGHGDELRARVETRTLTLTLTLPTPNQAAARPVALRAHECDGDRGAA